MGALDRANAEPAMIASRTVFLLRAKAQRHDALRTRLEPASRPMDRCGSDDLHGHLLAARQRRGITATRDPFGAQGDFTTPRNQSGCSESCWAWSGAIWDRPR